VIERHRASQDLARLEQHHVDPVAVLGLRDTRSDARYDTRGGRVRFSRITVDPAQLGGVPCIRRLRIPVATVVGMVAQGMSVDEILAEYPDLEDEDVREALRFAAALLEERELPLRDPA
jgi:uncharacterized protein (DUF433 family)